MNSGGKGAIDGRGRHPLRVVLVGLQIAVAFVTLTTAGLFIRGLRAAQTVDLGFEPHHLFVFSFDLNTRGMSESRGREFAKTILTNASSVPGVRGAALSTARPFWGSGGRTMLSEEQDLSAPSGVIGSNIGAIQVSPGYFEVTRLRLEAGRFLNEFDRDGSAPVAVINQALANHFWPGKNALGKRFRLRDEQGNFRQVVGIVADVVQGDIGEPVM